MDNRVEGLKKIITKRARNYKWEGCWVDKAAAVEEVFICPGEDCNCDVCFALHGVLQAFADAGGCLPVERELPHKSHGNIRHMKRCQQDMLEASCIFVVFMSELLEVKA